MTALIDTCTFAGHWPFRSLSHEDPDSLKEHLLSKGVTQAWVAACEAILAPDPMQANEHLFEAVSDDSFFLTVSIVNVTLATWRSDAERCLSQCGSRALKLLPNYHQYELSDPRVEELVALAEDADIPVCIQMRMMDERSHHPLMKVPGVRPDDVVALAADHPGARFLVCGAYANNLKPLAATANIWAETSLVESEQALCSAVTALGPDRVVFGSLSPLMYFEAMAAKLDVDPEDVPAEVVDAVREANASTLLGGPGPLSGPQSS